MQVTSDETTRVNGGSEGEHLPLAPKHSDQGLGEKFGSAYRVEGLLGSGGSGVVYQVEHVFLGKRFALKRLHSTREKQVQRFVNEARALAALRHPNIVNVSDFGHADDGSPFMVMELLEGESLIDVIRMHAPMPRQRAISMIQQILRGLAAAHQLGIVHRDIKPANCFCTKGPHGDEEIKILDFGIAALASAQIPLTRAPAEMGITGTLRYMSPEQASGQGADARSDLYSVGIVLYELLTGKPPFHGFGTEKLLYHKVFGPTPSLAQANPDLAFDAELEEILARALAQKPNDRFPCADDFSAALAAYLPDDEEKPTRAVVSRPDYKVYADVLQHLAQRVKSYWVEGVLRHEISEHPVADLEYSIDYSLIKEVWEDAMHPPTRTARVVRTPLYQTFTHLGRSLLILGEAGSGKTFSLLTLCEVILSRIAHDQHAEINVPVILTLSTWSTSQRDLVTWMIGELRSKYHVPASIARALLEARLITPFLDGLDEVEPRHRAACVDAINRFLESYASAGCVVVCRSESYHDLPRLALAAAICLRPLDAEQLEAYFSQATETEDERTRLVHASAGLGELAGNPWMLRLLLSLVKSGVSGAQSAASEPGKLNHELIQNYLDHALTRTGKRALRWSHREIRRTLAWLAAGMRGSHQTVFKWEELQPNWLHVRGPYLACATGLSALLFGASFILGFGLTPLRNFGFSAGIDFGLDFALATALVAFVYYFGWSLLRFRHKVDLQPPALARTTVALTLATAVKSGGIAACLVPRYGPEILPMIVEAGLFGAFVFGQPMLRRHLHEDIRTRDAIAWSFHGLQHRLLVVLALTLTIGGAVAFLEAPGAGLCVAAATCVLGLTLALIDRRKIDPQVAPNRGIHATFGQALALAGIVGTAISLIVAVSYGLPYGSCVGLTFAILTFLRFGGDDVIRHYTLRLALGLHRRLPGDLAGILDAAVDRQVLRRIGGGYMFIHGGLMDGLVDDHQT
jgi:serine/threonine protein kinase